MNDKKKSFNFSCAVTVSAYTTVFAETEEEALKIAKEREAVLEFNGSGESAEESWLIGYADGEPHDVEIVL